MVLCHHLPSAGIEACVSASGFTVQPWNNKWVKGKITNKESALKQVKIKTQPSKTYETL